MLPISLKPTLAAGNEPAANSHVDTPERITEAAHQFESLLVEQLMKTVRESGEGSWMGGDDKSSQSLMEYAEQEFARVMSRAGGFGIAKTVVNGLTPRSPSQK